MFEGKKKEHAEGNENVLPKEEVSLPEELSVLFLDDDRILRKLFSRSIKKLLPGCKIQEASSCETAIRLVDTEAEAFDVIFMDQYVEH
jgi:CheY-like chemotaxis protein